MTIGQIQDLYEYLEFGVRKGYIEEEVAQEYVENQDWESVQRVKDFQELHYPEEFEWDVAGLMP